MDKPFCIFTDHKLLTSMMNKPLGEVTNDRLARMMEKIAWAQFEVRYLPGSRNHVADLLSCNPSEREPAEDIPRHSHMATRARCNRGLVKKDKSLNNIA